jgi:hypothetical protein
MSARTAAVVTERERGINSFISGEYKRLAASVKGPVYTDPRGNPFDIDGVPEEVDKAIDRVAKLNESAQHQK